VWRREVFTRTGRKCVLLSKGLLCFRVWGTKYIESDFGYFRDSVQYGLKEISYSAALRKGVCECRPLWN
jgi:hypothetical protein